MKVAAIIVAGGSGTRAGAGPAKQFRRLAGRTVLERSLELFTDHPAIFAVQPVLPADAGVQIGNPRTHCLAAVAGGSTRQLSVRAGLAALSSSPPDCVLIHDAARPLASRALVDRAINTLAHSAAAIPALPVSDTLKRIGADGAIRETIDREGLRSVQTPQAFRYRLLFDAHEQAARAGRSDFTDDGALMEWAGHRVDTFDGEQDNLKLTTSEDFQRAEMLLAGRLGDIRTGTGYDVHAFGDGDHVVLGGVAIPHTRALSGHSDADALLHALTDAILGALAAGDIGDHFPPSDARWRGEPSATFLAFASERVCERGGMIAHLDATLICETPRIGPYRDQMRESIAAICGIEPDRVGLKATTNEKLGFIGRNEGIAAMATATLRLPWSRE
jgi:2-C-methyl-D-erythritol 4-phosphate cytidylyltransferase/2-C-methyl-D-erythritol 2,4-cyclodiphosphate synthase